MSARPLINLILATGKSGQVGLNDALPWKNPEELEHFKRTTLGSPIIYGRKTFQSMGRVLPGRRNIIVSTKLKYIPGAEVVPSLADALKLLEGTPEVFVIGGVQLWTEALPLADAAMISEVDYDGEADTHLPPSFFADLHALYYMRGFNPKSSFNLSYWQRLGSTAFEAAEQ